jgi:hypothetical protein
VVLVHSFDVYVVSDEGDVEVLIGDTAELEVNAAAPTPKDEDGAGVEGFARRGESAASPRPPDALRSQLDERASAQIERGSMHPRTGWGARVLN